MCLEVRIPAGELVRRLVYVAGEAVEVAHVRRMGNGSHEGRDQQLAGQAVPVEAQEPPDR